jgi:hypothetical protein
LRLTSYLQDTPLVFKCLTRVSTSCLSYSFDSNPLNGSKVHPKAQNLTVSLLPTGFPILGTKLVLKASHIPGAASSCILLMS